MRDVNIHRKSNKTFKTNKKWGASYSNWKSSSSNSDRWSITLKDIFAFIVYGSIYVNQIFVVVRLSSHSKSCMNVAGVGINTDKKSSNRFDKKKLGAIFKKMLNVPPKREYTVCLFICLLCRPPWRYRGDVMYVIFQSYVVFWPNI